jgi:hypothetical protein
MHVSVFIAYGGPQTTYFSEILSVKFDLCSTFVREYTRNYLQNRKVLHEEKRVAKRNEIIVWVCVCVGFVTCGSLDICVGVFVKRLLVHMMFCLYCVFASCRLCIFTLICTTATE